MLSTIMFWTRYSGPQKSWPLLPCISYGSRGYDFCGPLYSKTKAKTEWRLYWIFIERQWDQLRVKPYIYCLFVPFLLSVIFSYLWKFAKFAFYFVLSVQKYCSLECISNLSNLKTKRDATKKHSIRSMDRANIFRIHFVLNSCISVGSQVLRQFENIGGRHTFATDGTVSH